MGRALRRFRQSQEYGRYGGSPGSLSAILQLQKRAGNRAVLQLLRNEAAAVAQLETTTTKRKRKQVDEDSDYHADTDKGKKKQKIIKSRKVKRKLKKLEAPNEKLEAKRKKQSEAASARLKRKRATFKSATEKLNQGLTDSKWKHTNVSLAGGEIHKVPLTFATKAENNAGPEQEHVSSKDLYNDNRASLVPPRATPRTGRSRYCAGFPRLFT
ncbi:hypothetical protein LJK87_11145 [Paenibacillus sp. P25]|nr:hypothetical protein LJK87_11145 [Paenibacillus sp. P25]